MLAEYSGNDIYKASFILTSFLQFVLLLVSLTEHLGITFLLAGHHTKACNMAIHCQAHSNHVIRT